MLRITTKNIIGKEIIKAIIKTNVLIVVVQLVGNKFNNIFEKSSNSPVLSFVAAINEFICYISALTLMLRFESNISCSSKSLFIFELFDLRL